ncbi:MAG: hypothetical protein M9947_17730 [Thermomicrobiales bacterium]|nr:hypothetical protein [Thermomicrobiales bacterium]
MILSKFDAKGRLVVPKKIREEHEIKAGDLYVLQENSEADTITFVKMEKAILQRIAEGEAEHKAGKTVSLDDFAAELGIDLQRD